MSVDVTKMPKLGFGLMRLPEKNGELDLEQLCKMVDAYMASGMNYFDTAYMYCGGKSESIIKKALVERYPRDSFTLTTKLPQWMMDEGIDGRDRIFNEQLARTGAGYFDYYLLHSVEDGANYEGYVKYDCFNWAMKKKEEGLIRHFGFSFHGTPELLDKILSEHPEVEIVQIQMNYADWENPLVQSGRLYEVLRKYNMPFLVMEPVKGGSLASASPEVEAEMKKIKPDASVASWALRFAASLPGVATVLSGMSNEEQMNDNLKTFTNFEPLSEEERKVIEKAQDELKKNPRSLMDKSAAPRKPSKVSSESYDAAFLKRNEIKTRQCVYISREIHKRISRIVSVLAKHELTVGGYIDLILERHLEENQEEINGLLRKEIDDWNM